MIKSPPDPQAAFEAEQRSEDDGMPEHPQKSVDPVSWAEEHVEREKAATLGYPRHRIGQALVDLDHSLQRFADLLWAPKNRFAVTLVTIGVAAGVTAYLTTLARTNSTRRYR